ncbi:MAG: flavodoxin domain-containing protein [Candidatus Omnitrophota bacterium]
MQKALVVYYSQSGNTKAMADIIFHAIQEEEVEVVVKAVTETQARELLEYDAIIMGSPTYYGTMAYEVKKLLDESVQFHGRLSGKIGAAFSSSANIGGGNETTIIDILKSFLIHGMIIQGDAKGDHYGPVAINLPDERATNECKRFGKRIAKLVKQIFE